MPCESTPRRLDATRHSAAILALHAGVPAAIRMSSENFVRAGAAMRGIVLNVAHASARALSGATARLFTNAATPGVPVHITRFRAAATLVKTGRKAPGRENFMAKKMEGLEQLLVEELQDLFDAEKQ